MKWWGSISVPASSLPCQNTKPLECPTSLCGASLAAQWRRIHLWMQEMWVPSLGREEPLEEEMATHSRVLAWKTPWTEEPGGSRFKGLQRVTQLNDWVCTHTHMHTFIQDKMWSSASSTHFTGELDRMQDLGPHPPPLKESLPSTQGPRLLLRSLRLEKPCTTPFHDPPFTYYKLFY